MKERLAQAEEILRRETPIDKIVQYYIDRDYVEFICKSGKDTCTYRVYRGGTLVER